MHPRGSHHSSSKLCEQKVVEIRERHAAGEMIVSLAREFGVRTTTISKIVHGKCWTHVGGPLKAPGKIVGSRRSTAKINEEIAREIRVLHFGGLSNRKLAARYGICHQLVAHIVNFRRWRHAL